MFVFTSIVGTSQDFQGMAFYQTKQLVTVQIDSSQVNQEQENQIKQIVTSQLERNYELVFDNYQSLYKESENLTTSGQPGVRIIITGEPDVFYRNTKEERYVNKTELYGKPFLIKDTTKRISWKLTGKSKHVGQYQCYQAKAVINNNKDIEFNKNITEIIAWYTPEIPVMHGPSQYWGLPGLILEVNDGKQILICTKIALNPKKKSIIKEPIGGKEVNQEEYNIIKNKKVKEMKKREQKKHIKKDRESVQISIQG